MRLLTLLSLPVLAGGIVLAADGPESFTYIEGNVSSLTANAGGTVSFMNDKAFELRTSSNKLEVPYDSISKAELGIVKTHSPTPEPIYKVWALHKRILGKTQTQQLTLSFKDASGQDQNMTVELSKTAANNIVATVESLKVPEPAKEAWWGDKIWKTSSNADTWTPSDTLARK